MGVFARVNAVNLVEDIPLNEEEWKKKGYAGHLVDDAYAMLSTNCFIATGIYAVILMFAGFQLYVNQRVKTVV